MLRSVYFFLLCLVGSLCLLTSISAKEWCEQDGSESIHIHSSSQQVLANGDMLFEGEVEASINKDMHIWADKVVINKNRKILTAEETSSGPVAIQTLDFFIVVDRIFFDLQEKIGHADNVRIHVHEGYISTRHIEKKGEYEWIMKDMLYTACSNDNPHWQLSAKRAKMRGPYYFVHLSGMVVKVGRLPVFGLPYMTFPIQSKSKSGFLIPKFYIDYHKGFGFTQEYYLHFGPTADTTIGVNWRKKKGIAFSDELRWARSLESFTFFHGYWAIAENALFQRDNEVLSATRYRYWLQGENFHSIKNILNGEVNSLLRLDFGTDKRIGYQFFEDLDKVENSFSNSLISSLSWPSHLFTTSLEYSKAESRQFKFVDNQIQEVGTSVFVASLPRFSWHIADQFINFFSYRHDLICDQMYYTEEESEQFFSNQRVVQNSSLIPLTKANTLRMNYEGSLHAALRYRNYGLSYILQPVVQARSKILKNEFLRKNVFEERLASEGSVRFFMKSQAMFCFPEINMPLSLSRSNSWFLLQPQITWNYVPKFRQNHWFYMDYLDKIFPQNLLAGTLQAHWLWPQAILSAYLTQGYDFYQASDLLPLCRSFNDRQHLTPLECIIQLQSSPWTFSLSQEFDIPRQTLLTAHVLMNYTQERFKVGLGYLYQHHLIQEKRLLLSDISHFFLMNVSVPIKKSITVHYDGQFYDESGRRHILGFSRLKPLLHCLRFDYQGHCWGFYVGYEEKFYRELGNRRSERAIIFSLRLDSLGSFAKRFKRPPAIIKESI